MIRANFICFHFVHLSAISFACALGCGGDSVPLVAGTGKVTYRGNPVVDAHVTFYPQSGPSAFGMTNAEGEFSLSTNGKSGAVAGDSVKVAVVAVEEVNKLEPSVQHPEGLIETKSKIPEKYGMISSTPLTVTVASSGENHFLLELTD